MTLRPLVLALAGTALAQAVYGSIGGTVTDESGGVLPGVTVTITSTERNTVDTVVTNESGYFTKERMLPGTYQVIPTQARENYFPEVLGHGDGVVFKINP